ncbi:MAG: HupE/UreJ family protein [Cyanobacteria bacterium J06614_10]
MKNSLLTSQKATGQIWARRVSVHRLLTSFLTSFLNGGALSVMALATLAMPALAHHPFGGDTPETIWAGLLSGMGHPVIGLDHLAFVVAAGLLAAVVRGGLGVPIAFVLATLAGTGAHLAEVSLPGVEWLIATSVVVFGLLAVQRVPLNAGVVMLLAAIAGIFHGYAYGEAVVGAEPTPLVAYLIGFAAVQGAIALLAYFLSRRALSTDKTAGLVRIHHAGFVVLGAGLATLGGLLV